MLKNDYRRALIMLRPIRQGLSGHVRLERRTLMGSMQFTVNGVPSGSELHAALIGHPGGRYVGAKLGAFGDDRYGQVGLTVRFDPRNIQSFTLEQYDLICVVLAGKGGAPELVLSGNLNGSVEVDWGKVHEVARTLYKPARSVSRPVTDLPAAAQAESPADAPLVLAPGDADEPIGAQEDAISAADAASTDAQAVPTFERLKSLRLFGAENAAKQAEAAEAEAAPEAQAAEPEAPAPKAMPEVQAAEPEAPAPEAVPEAQAAEPEAPAPEAVPEMQAAEPEAPAPEAVPEVQAAEPEVPAPKAVPEVQAAEPEVAQPERTKSKAPAPQAEAAPKPDAFDTPARYPEAVEPAQPDAPAQVEEAAPCVPEVQPAEPPIAGSLLALDISLAWPPLIEPLRHLFMTQPAEVPFDAPGYCFVRAPLPAETGLTHCMVGIRCRDGRPRAVCYAVPATFDIETPPGLEGYTWRGDGCRGYWVIWQDAECGEAIAEGE